ncbi:MAG: adenylate/guanylate cyclase domain-containing protein [Bacteroidota bacterium]
MAPQPLHTYLRSALQIGLFWGILGTLQMLYEYNVLVNYKVLPDYYSFPIIFQSIVIPIFISGLLVGFFLMHRVNVWLRKYPYGIALFYVLLSFSILYIFINICAAAVYNILYLEVEPNARIVWQNVWLYFTSWENFKNYVFWTSINLVTILALQINDKYGPGNFRAFLRGKYFQPQMEERIFMFLDLRASTHIAESLDELEYFEFVKDFYKDATDGILANRGEIEKYIGDEILIGWPVAEGLRYNRCIHAFFDIKATFEKRKQAYLKKYNVVPDFKAGLHVGKAIVGEIGVIKKDIAFSGDVLNTASRIQSACNELGVDLLFSEELAEQLDWEGDLELLPMGQVNLKGKQEEVALFSAVSRKVSFFSFDQL